MLAAYYVPLLRLHVGCVACSGTLFALRGAMRVADSPLANHLALRVLSWLIDSTLLGAAILLCLIVHQYPLLDAWLTSKVALLVLYVGLGTLALKRARTRAGRGAAVAASLLTFCAILGVAITHRPAGWLSLLPR